MTSPSTNKLTSSPSTDRGGLTATKRGDLLNQNLNEHKNKLINSTQDKKIDFEDYTIISTGFEKKDVIGVANAFVCEGLKVARVVSEFTQPSQKLQKEKTISIMSGKYIYMYIKDRILMTTLIALMTLLTHCVYDMAHIRYLESHG